MPLPDQLLRVMAALSASEINCTVATFREGGWTLKLGDDANGLVAERSFAPPALDHAVRCHEAWTTSPASRAHPTLMLGRSNLSLTIMA